MVTLCLDNGRTLIRGEMVDISPSGFRIRYRGAPLRPGSSIQINYPWGNIYARVIWIRALDGWRDAGLLVCDEL